MNIYTVRDNLKNTIAGKEAYVQELAEKAQFAGYPKNKVYEGMVKMLDLNIDELKSTGLSFMPEGLEKNVNQHEMADVISFLKNWRYLDGQVPLGK